VVVPSPPKPQIFGVIDPYDDPGMDEFAITGDMTVDVGDAPTVTFNFPQTPPAVDTSGQPTHPSSHPVTYPKEPSWTEPPLPPLMTLTVPVFSGIKEPLFKDYIPIFSATPPAGLMYTPGEYVSTLLDKLKNKIFTFLDGGTGMPIAIQDALFQAARQREQQTALAAQQTAFDTWAGRGFGMPPGMLVEVVESAYEKSRFAENALERDILSKSAQWEIENLRHYVAQGVALESALMQMWNQMEQRTLDAAKAQADIEVEIYKLAVSLYEMQQNARKISAEVYKAQWEGEAAKVAAYKAQIDAVVAQGQLNEQYLKVYLGMWEGIKAEAQVYATTMQGSQIMAETNKIAIEGYGADVQAWLGVLKARMTPIEVYTETMKGEAVKATALESMTKGFVATVQAQEIEANVKMKQMGLQLESVNSSVNKYQATLKFMSDHIQAQLANIQAQAAAFNADTGRYKEEISGENQTRALTMQTQEQRLRNNIEYYGTQLREFDALLARQIERVKIILEASKSAGQIGASLAAGAMSAIHVSSAISGQGSVGAQNNTSMQRTIASQVSAGIQETYSFQNPSAQVPQIPMPQLP
jgi:hypothetical protein